MIYIIVVEVLCSGAEIYKLHKCWYTIYCAGIFKTTGIPSKLVLFNDREIFKKEPNF